MNDQPCRTSTLATDNSAHSTSKITVGYILSHPFSGSTLLSLMLAAHSEVATVGELVGVNSQIRADENQWRNYLCSCGQRVFDCSFWNELADRLALRGIAFRHPDLGTRFDPIRNRALSRALSGSIRSSVVTTTREWVFRTLPPFRGRFRQAARTNLEAVKEILAMTGKRVFIDESKNLSQFMRLADAAIFDLRGILLTRDGRAVAHSTRNRGRKTFPGAVRSWRRFHQVADLVLPRTNCPILHVRYENLCSNPTRTLGDVEQFLGLAPEPWPPTGDVPKHHVLGNDMRLKFRNVIQHDLRWKENLTAEDLQVFQRLTHDLPARYAYTD